MGLHCSLFKIIIVGFYFKNSIRMSNSSGLILVQTVCKGYQQATLSKQRVKAGVVFGKVHSKRK